VAAAFLQPRASRFEIFENNFDLSLKFYGIKGSSPMAMAHIACVQSVWGKDVIHQINHVLETTDILEKGIEYYLEWLSNDIHTWYRSEAKKLLKP